MPIARERNKLFQNACKNLLKHLPDGAGVCVGEDVPGTIEIKKILVTHPNQGIGTRILQLLCRLADQHGVDLILTPEPLRKDPEYMNETSLRQWYKKHGFKDDGIKKMRRIPHKSDPDKK